MALEVKKVENPDNRIDKVKEELTSVKEEQLAQVEKELATKEDIEVFAKGMNVLLAELLAEKGFDFNEALKKKTKEPIWIA